MRIVPVLTVLFLLLTTSLLSLVTTDELDAENLSFDVVSVENEVALLSILDPIANDTYRVNDEIGMRILVANLGTESIMGLTLEVELWKSTVHQNTELDDSWDLVNTWEEVLVCATCYETEIESASLLGIFGHDLTQVFWIAEEGHYRFIARVVMEADTDLTNNQIQMDFGVYEPFDIQARAYWDATGTDTLALEDSSISTTCPSVGMCYDFNVNISYGMLNPGGGPTQGEDDEPDFSIRDIVVELRVTNEGVNSVWLIDDRTGAEDHFYDADDTTSIFELDRNGIFSRGAIVGYAMDSQNVTRELRDERYVAEVNAPYNYHGRLAVDDTDHGFQIEAEVTSFKLWQNTTISNYCVIKNQEMGVSDWLPCEEELSEDSIKATDKSVIKAYDATFEDIDFISMTFESRLSPSPTPKLLSQGDNNIYFEVLHMGNDPMNNSYEYAIDVIIDTPTDRVDDLVDVNSLDPETSPTAYRCSTQREDHNQIGGPNPAEDMLCLTYRFAVVGTYDILAMVRIVNDDEFVDEIILNDFQHYVINVVNNAPFVVLDMESDEPLTLQNDFLLKVSGLDYDAAPDDSRNFRYDLQLVQSDGNVTSIGCIDELQMGASKYCEGRIETEWLWATHVRGMVTDIYGAAAWVDIPITVWARGVFEDESGDFSYDIAYRSASRLEMEVTEDVNSDGMVNSEDAQNDIELTGLPGEYDSIGAWKITQTSPDPENIGDQSLKISFRREADAEANGTLWHFDETTSEWTLLQTRVFANDGFKKRQTIIWEPALGEDILPSGLYAAFIAKAGNPPSVGLDSLFITNLPTGLVEVEWVLDGVPQSEDVVMIYYSSGTTAFQGDDAASHSITNRFVTSWVFQGGVHGETFQFTVRTENPFGINNDGALSGSVMIDGFVDPEPEVTNVQLTEQAVNVLVTWESTNTVDVDHWQVCRGVDSSSLTSCFDTDGTATQLLTLKPQVKVKWFYAISAVDAHGNKVQLGQASLDLSSGVQGSEPTENENIGTTVEGALPAWTYPAIVGVVLLSVVAGVILVVRGGGGGDDEAEWDY